MPSSRILATRALKTHFNNILKYSGERRWIGILIFYTNCSIKLYYDIENSITNF